MPTWTAEPRVSVLMGTWYRREDTALLRRSVESILAQSLEDLELILCADGSRPEALRLLEELAARDRRVRPVSGVGAYDLASRLNFCLERAGGRWIARMDDDDYSCPTRLARELTFLEENPNIAFVGCNVDLERESGPAGAWSFPPFPTPRDFFLTQPFVHPTLLFRREALEAVGGYSTAPRCRKCEDYDLLLRLYEHGYAGANLQERLFRYRVPERAREGRAMGDRLRECRTRWVRFRALGLLPGALPYVLKPAAVGLLPEGVLARIKEKKSHG